MNENPKYFPMFVEVRVKCIKRTEIGVLYMFRIAGNHRGASNEADTRLKI